MSRPILLFALILAACGTPSATAPAAAPAASVVAEDGSREVTMDVREQLI